MGSFCSEGEADKRLADHYATEPQDNLYKKVEKMLDEIDAAQTMLSSTASADMAQGPPEIVGPLESILEAISEDRNLLGIAVRALKKKAKEAASGLR